MDSGFKIGAVDPETLRAMAPNNHRILDEGHTFFESIKRAREVGEQEGWSDVDTFTTWFKSYFTDLSSPAGMPAFGAASDNIYDFLRDIGFSEAVARDLVTVNGQEAIEALIGGSLSVISLALAWKDQDKENFSKALGAIGLGGVVSMNPAILVVVIVAAALGYNTLVCQKTIGRGVVVSASAMLTSAIIPGPVLLGVLPAVVMSIYVNKKLGEDFDLSAQVKETYSKLRDPATRQLVQEQAEKLLQSLRPLAEQMASRKA
jgi:hypothetical protein